MPQREEEMADNKKAENSGEGMILDPKESGLTVLLMLLASGLAAVVALTLIRVCVGG
jgi:hypothetical protein